MKWITFFMLIISLTWINPAYADNDHRFPMDLNDLDLSKQQHRFVEDAMKEYQLSYRRYHHQSDKTQDELNALFMSTSFDAEKFRSKSLEMQKASIEIRARLLERLHSILTPEQKRRFIRHLEEWEIE